MTFEDLIREVLSVFDNQIRVMDGETFRIITKMMQKFRVFPCRVIPFAFREKQAYAKSCRPCNHRE